MQRKSPCKGYHGQQHDNCCKMESKLNEEINELKAKNERTIKHYKQKLRKKDRKIAELTKALSESKCQTNQLMQYLKVIEQNMNKNNTNEANETNETNNTNN